MTTQEVLEDFSLPLNPVQLTDTPPSKPWPFDHQLLLISLVHSACRDQSLPDTALDWNSISRKLQFGSSTTDTEEGLRTNDLFSPKSCENQYHFLMNSLDGDKAQAKRILLIRSIAEDRAKASNRREQELRAKLSQVGDQIKNLNTTGGLLDSNISEMSDAGGTDSEEEEHPVLPHPFDDRESLMAHLKHAFLDEGSLVTPPMSNNLPVPVESNLVQIPEVVVQASSPTNNTIDLKTTSNSGQAVSPQLKNLVKSAIEAAVDDDKSTTIPPPTNAPTLSMLLEMPPRDRGQPLPQIKTLMGDPATTSQTTVSTKLISPANITTAGTTLSPSKILADDSGRKDGAGLSDLSSLPLKTQDEIEIANDFVISSGLVQEVEETYAIPVAFNNSASEVHTEAAQFETPDAITTVTAVIEGVTPLELAEEYLKEIVSEEALKVSQAEVPSKKVANMGPNQGNTTVSPSKSPIEPSGVESTDTKESQGEELSGVIDSGAVVEPSVPSEVVIKIENESGFENSDIQDKEILEEIQIVTDNPTHSVEGSCDDDVDRKGVTNPETGRADVIEDLDNSKTAIGRSKKLSHEKTEEATSAPLTRHSVREKGVKLEETSLVSKKGKDISSPPSRRSTTRAGAIDETRQEPKQESETPSSPNKVYGAGSRKIIPRGQESHAPNLRSRRGPTPTPIGSHSDEKCSTGRGQLLKKSITAADEDPESEKVDSGSSTSQTESVSVDRSPRKFITEKEKTKESHVKSEDDSNGEHSDAALEDDKVLSGVDEESCDADEILKKKRGKASPRKERSESGEMADDDNSNSATDGNQKKRLTRRGIRSSPQKSDGKLLENSAEENSSKELEMPSGKDSKSRQSKTMSRLKHLNDEAHQLFGEMEMKEEDDNGKRITRARAKTSTSPGSKSKSSSSKVSANQSVEHDVSSEAERGPSRATRSRAAASTGGGHSTHCVLDTLPTTVLDSNPSSPSSSTTNSINIDEDRDQRVFRKSMMVLWNRIAAHKSACVFLKPITDEAVPGYSKKVKRPMDLTTIKKNIESGVIKKLQSFERDLYLMFLNAVMFNPRTHAIIGMTTDMETDTAAILDDFKNTQKLMKIAQDKEELNRKEESDVEQEAQEEEKPKASTSKAAGRKRRIRSTSAGNTDEPVESKRRTLRTSTTAATTAASAWQGLRKDP